MYLFIFAFLGNTFYVISILTAPEIRQLPPADRAFIQESIPCVSVMLLTRSLSSHFYRYLLGSAGTLIFDVSIVSQSLIYRSKSPRHRGRRGSMRRRTNVEEETGLLSADVLAGQRGSLSRSKSRTSSL